MAGEGKECSGGRFLNWREDQGVWREGGGGALGGCCREELNLIMKG